MNTVEVRSGDTSSTVKTILTVHRTEPEDLLPVLHAIQDEIGFIPQDLVTDIASAFNLSRAEVHGVISFYHHFRVTPPAKHVIQICRAESCQSMGGNELLAHAEKTLGCDLHKADANGTFSLEPVYCLGQCATSPAIMIDDKVYARVTPARFDKLIAKARSE
ncbi:MAG TPA: formate dehydrogenase subunit gamma [Burkholderiaceae bacterium]|nr:formate dehydrogenase subunit gamma [Burkholderiaceae bacterium]